MSPSLPEICGAANVDFWARAPKTKKATRLVKALMIYKVKASLTSLRSRVLAIVRNIASVTNVVISAPRDYVERTKVVVFCGIGTSPVRAIYNVPSLEFICHVPLQGFDVWEDCWSSRHGYIACFACSSVCDDLMQR